ncbi:hypothetical protein GCM10009850_094100 [Nonomuraea monospora]|uniref:Phage replication-related protein YjqB (UPF0714/DUF867 family) n=1 Tax=Nonomuraea monospora TaxID=568818 RepID=A0ABN3CXI7_9ACTN
MPAFLTRVVTAALAVGVAAVPAPALADVYADYADLAAHEVEGVDYRVVHRLPAGAGVSHIAIHGGAIEAGTSQLAGHAAGQGNYAFYAFEGVKPTGNSALHLTSTHFDEPRALAVQSAVSATVSWHGASGATPATYVGGRDEELIERVGAALEEAGFAVAAAVPPELAGTSPRNIANRNLRGMGVQLEVSEGQRRRFFEQGRLSRAWIEDPAHWTADFHAYVAAVRDALSG